MSIEIRRVDKARLPEMFEPISAVFGSTPNPERIDRARAIEELDTLYAAFDGEQVVASGGAFSFELSVPYAAPFEISGLTLIAVLSTHRRRGILTAMMRRHLDEAHARGVAVAALFASEGGIYGRFGYGLASMSGDIELRKERTMFAPSLGNPKGGLPKPLQGPAGAPNTRVRLVDEETAMRAMPIVWERVRGARPGMLSRSESWWRVRRIGDPLSLRGGRPPLQRALVEVDGELSAYALFRLTCAVSFADPGAFGVEVLECIGDRPEGTRAAWRFLLDLDLIRFVRARMLPLDHPLTFLLAEPAALRMRLDDALYIRLVDVGAALSKRGYRANPGPIVFDVSDSFCPWNEGRWRLADGVATRTDAAADLALDARTLGAAYLGAFGFTQLALAGRVRELRAGALAHADAMFQANVLPWSPDIF